MTGPHVVLRADASLAAGTGHVVRSCTLATALVGVGWRATLASRDLPEGLRRSALAGGLQIVDLPADVAPEREPETLAGVTADPPTLLVVDDYRIGFDWLDQARAWAPTIMAIDDLADRPLPVDVLLNQNLGANEAGYGGLVPAGVRLLLGPSYALLRPEFERTRASLRHRSGRLERVLVFISGSDPDDVTQRAAEGVVVAGVPADVVVGSAYPHVERLRAWAAARPLVRLHVDTDDMAGLMARADLSVGAPSSASWERCAEGLPAVLLTLAENQLGAERHLVAAGAALALGWHTGVQVEDIARAVTSLQHDPERLRAMSDAAARITDGGGTSRVIAALERALQVQR